MRISLLLPLGLLGCSQQIAKSPSVEDDFSDTEEVEETEDNQDEENEEENEETPDTNEPEEEDDEEENEEEEDEEEVVEVISFDKVPLFDFPGIAWLHAVDLNNDGTDEYLVTSMSEGVGDWPTFIGAGAAYILSQTSDNSLGQDIGAWSATVAFDRTYEIDWPNDSSFFDVNNDGIKDWVIGTGFIPIPDGGITWMPGIEDTNGDLSFDMPDIIETPWTDRFYHKAYPVDMDNDGDMDFVTTNYKNAETDWLGNETAPGEAKLEWYENDGIPNQTSFTHHAIGDRGGALLALHDVDNDGDTDIIIPQFFNGASLIWMENPGSTTGSWTEHIINNNTGKGFDAELADMNGDGKMDIVYGNHNHQGSSNPEEQVMGIYWFEIPPAQELQNLDNWDAYMNVVFEGFYVDEPNVEQNGAPGVFHTGDVNGDGRMDVSVSGDGDDGMYVFIQEENGDFSEILVDSGQIMSGDHHMADFNNDGKMDYIWAIYGSLDLLSGQLEPASEINIYLQTVTTVTESDAPQYNGNLAFEITTSFGPDTCNGSVELAVTNNVISGTYQCSFGVIGAQNHEIRGTVDGNGNITGEIDVTTVFSSDLYSLEWTGTFDGTTIEGDTTSSGMLDTMAVDYTLQFSAQ